MWLSESILDFGSGMSLVYRLRRGDAGWGCLRQLKLLTACHSCGSSWSSREFGRRQRLAVGLWKMRLEWVMTFEAGQMARLLSFEAGLGTEILVSILGKALQTEFQSCSRSWDSWSAISTLELEWVESLSLRQRMAQEAWVWLASIVKLSWSGLKSTLTGLSSRYSPLLV